jgi:hypothetical protein
MQTRFAVFLFFMLLSFTVIPVYAVDPMDRGVGVVLGTVVNVRKSASLDSEIVATVTEGEYVKIVQWTDVKQKIDGYNDCWVKIKTQANRIGYLYGAFIFEVDALFSNEWIADTCSGLALSIEFTRQGNFTFYLGCNEPGCDEPQREKGTFAIQGRKITLSVRLEYDTHEFYLFRFQGGYVLETHKVDIEKVPAYCWGWRPAGK